MLRRLGVVAAVLLLASGCKNAFSGHEDIVATAGGQNLTVDRIAAMVAPAKSVPLRRDIIDRVAELWVDYQLLGQAIAHGDSLLDSATVDAANWPLLVQTIANTYHDSVVVGAKVTDQQIDSAYAGTDHRWISHILVMAKTDTTAAVKAAKRRLAEGYLSQVQHGANFAQLAGRVSEDQGSKANGGSVGMFGRGQMVKPFEDEAFALKPGEMSNHLVETAYGYHILYRPPLAAIRDSFKTRVQDIIAQRLDSIFLDSLTNKTGIDVRSSAAQTARATIQNLRAAKSRSRTMATWRGGRLEEKQFAIWLQAYPPQTRAMIAQAPDSTVKEFVKNIARNEMLIRSADAHHIRVTHEQRDSIRMRYRSDLMTMITGMGIAPESLAADTAAGKQPKETIAARRVDAYFTAITNNTGRQYYEVPPFLADLLRSRFAYRINPAGVDRALERAKQLRGPEAAPGNPGNPLQRAPGGPPMGGGAAPGQKRP